MERNEMLNQIEVELAELLSKVSSLKFRLNAINGAVVRGEHYTDNLRDPSPRRANLNPEPIPHRPIFGERVPNIAEFIKPPPPQFPWGVYPRFPIFEQYDVKHPIGSIKPDTQTHVFFYEQDYYFLSNFSAFTVQWDGEDFDTAEAAYQWSKFPNHPDIQKAIRDARSVHEAHQIAKLNKHLRRSEWDAVKVNIMQCILEAKVQQHDYVKRKLLDTGTRVLVEDSWRDDFWGWGPDHNGRNMLGRLWMDIRKKLQFTTQVTEKPEASVEASVEEQPTNNGGGTSSQGDTVTVPADYFRELEKAILLLIPNIHYQVVHHSNCAHLRQPSVACDCDRRHIVEAARKAKRIRETLPLIQ